jgi:hypothetical protein
MPTSPPSTGVALPLGDSRYGRGHSKAYPRDRLGAIAKLQWYLRQNSKAAVATIAFLSFCLIISSDFIHDTGIAAAHLRNGGGEINFSGAVKPGYFSTEGSVVKENVFRFAAVTDLDQLSHFEDGDKHKYRSWLLPGIITRDPDTNQYSIKTEEARELVTGHNEAGRGAEFSELQIFNNRLLTFDDRTGDVFEIRNKPDGKSSFLVPRFVVTEGEGDTDKGMKVRFNHGLFFCRMFCKRCKKPNLFQLIFCSGNGQPSRTVNCTWEVWVKSTLERMEVLPTKTTCGLVS